MPLNISLHDIIREHENRIAKNSQSQLGSQSSSFSAAQGTLEHMTVDSGSGIMKPVFILGVHDPDDAAVNRWIP